MNGYKFNSKGELVPIKVNIVWGSPASGKSTYVKKNMLPGDMVVDLDLIKQAISMGTPENTSGNLIGVVISIRDHLYNLIANREISDGDVWVIACLPKFEERENLRTKLKADNLIYMKATEEDCYKRAMLDDTRKDKEHQRNIIYKWFKQFNYEW